MMELCIFGIFQVTGAYGEESLLFEGILLDETVPDKMHYVVEASFKSSGYDVSFHSGISAETTKAHVDAKITINGIDYTMLLEGTRTSLTLDVNALRHILISSYVSEMQCLMMLSLFIRDKCQLYFYSHVCNMK